jgi:hypothetical protein
MRSNRVVRASDNQCQSCNCPAFGSNFRITDPYIGGQLLTDPPDPDAQQCRNIFPALSDPTHAEVRIQLQNYGSVYLGGQLFTDPPDPDAQQCRK